MDTPKLSLQPLGKNGPLVPRIGLGCMGLSAFYGTIPSEEESLKLLNRSVDLGCFHLDTADVYGKNEELLAKLLETRRSDIFLATKFGAYVFDPADQAKYTTCPGNPEYVRISLERSLKRLGVSYVDLFYMHRMDPNTPVEDSVKAMAEFVKEGKVKYLGLSECSGETLRKAHAVHPIASVQIEYSPWCTDIETNGLLEVARELGVAIVAYSPLGRGFLSGKFKTIDDLEANDWRRMAPRFQGENFAKNYEVVVEFQKLAAELSLTPSQVVLAWILAQGNDFFVIPGTTNVDRLEENLVSDKVQLSKESIDKIRTIINSIEIHGGRYDEAGLKRCNI